MNGDRLDELDEEQRALALQLRTTLRNGEHVDAATAARLAQARSDAVANSRPGPSRSPWWWATGTAAALALVGVLVLKPAPPASTEPSAVDALEVMTDELDADFYEDLDLYRWLEQDGNV